MGGGGSGRERSRLEKGTKDKEVGKGDLENMKTHQNKQTKNHIQGKEFLLGLGKKKVNRKKV